MRPNITLIYESGTLATKPNILPLSIGDGELCETALTTVSVPEMFRYWLQGGRIKVGFLGGAQIDKYANLNTTVVGPYDKPKVRLPGGGGAPEIAISCGEIFIIMAQGKRSFVDKLDFVTSIGHGSGGDAREKLGVKTKGPTKLITDLALFAPDPETKEMTVVSIHPGVTREQIQEATGWPVKFAGQSGGDAAADRAGAGSAARPAGAHRPRHGGGGVMSKTSREVFICDAARTPIGRFGGSLAKVRADDLAAVPIRALKERNTHVDWEKLDEVFYGCANQAGEDNRNVARMALLLAGLPQSVPGVTLNRLCASGMEAVGSAARAIKAGEMEFAIAGGVESMTRAPFVQGKADDAFARKAEIFDTTIGWRFINPLMKQQYGVDSMPETGENVAEEFQVSRADQDAFALRSQMRAGEAEGRGYFTTEIVPVEAPGGKAGPVLVDRDEHPRPDTSLEQLAKLKAPFRKDGTVTAGNASGVNDGAAALIVASEKAVKEHGLTPRARVLGMASAAVPPRIMGIGPVPATRKLMERLQHKIGRLRSDRDQRSLRLAVARLPAPARPCRRRRARQPAWRGDRARPSARHVGRAPGADGGARPARARRQAGACHHVRRRRPGRVACARARELNKNKKGRQGWR